jgi:hypothetical protein
MHRCMTASFLRAVVWPGALLLAGMASAQPGVRGTQTRELAIRLAVVAIGPANRTGTHAVQIGVVADNRLPSDLMIAGRFRPGGHDPVAQLLPSRGSCLHGSMSLPYARVPNDLRAPNAWDGFVQLQSAASPGAGLHFKFECDRDALGATAQLTFHIHLGVMQGDEAPPRVVALAPTITGIELVQR